MTAPSQPEPTAVWRRLARRLACQRGITIVELLTTMSIMGVVISGIATALVSGSNAEADLNNRFRAQSNARTALGQLRRDIHGACSVTLTASTLTLTHLSVPPNYTCSVLAARWCTAGSGQKWALYRSTGASCSSTSVRRADYLLSGSVFSTLTTAGMLDRVHVDLTVDLDPADTRRRYRLTDAIAPRNAPRT